MKVYLAGTCGYVDGPGFYGDTVGDLYILESFYYQKDWMQPLIKQFKEFLLDSGAFTYMSGNGAAVDFDKYLEDYADFINKNDISLFFELDIDSVVGLKKVEQLRRRLESLTGKRSIPVWHRSRGKQYWLDMVKEYQYVAVGGIVSKEITRKEFPVFKWFLSEASKQSCRVHGLGFTSLDGLKQYPFYSVDSTSWLHGNRGGFLYKFNGRDMIQIRVPPGSRLKAREAAIHNFNEWVKFQRYAETHL